LLLNEVKEGDLVIILLGFQELAPTMCITVNGYPPLL